MALQAPPGLQTNFELHNLSRINYRLVIGRVNLKMSSEVGYLQSGVQHFLLEHSKSDRLYTTTSFLMAEEYVFMSGKIAASGERSKDEGFWWTRSAGQGTVAKLSRRGMVVSEHPLASEAGLRILRSGGNAVDAAVAVSATLSAVAPYMIGPGGSGFMLFYDASQQQVECLEFAGTTPAAATSARSLDRRKLWQGARGSLVPGCAAGWLVAHERYGGMDRRKLFEDAIHYAVEGFPVAPRISVFFERCAAMLQACPRASKVYLPKGRPPQPGEVLVQKELGQTLVSLSEEGLEPFYRGRIAEKIVAASREAGGLLDSGDLASFAPRWQKPLSSSYRGVQIHTPTFPGTGIQILETLKILEQFDLAAHGPDSSNYWHLLVEAIKLAIIDRINNFEANEAKVQQLLSDEYANRIASQVNRNRATPSGGDRFNAAFPMSAHAPGKGNTTYFCVVDREGNAVSSTQSLGNLFGCGVLAGDTGILLNNFMYWWDLDERSPAYLRAGGTPPTPMGPALAISDGNLHFVVGTPGSSLQIIPQVVVNLVDFGMSAQESVEFPRVISLGASEEIYLEALRGYGNPQLLAVEDRFAPGVLEGLAEKGHEVLSIGAYGNLMGCAAVISKHRETNVLGGGADPRRDSQVSCW